MVRNPLLLSSFSLFLATFIFVSSGMKHFYFNSNSSSPFLAAFSLQPHCSHRKLSQPFLTPVFLQKGSSVPAFSYETGSPKPFFFPGPTIFSCACANLSVQCVQNRLQVWSWNRSSGYRDPLKATALRLRYHGWPGSKRWGKNSEGASGCAHRVLHGSISRNGTLSLLTHALLG